MRPSGDEPKSPNIEHIRASERRSPDGMQRSCPEGRLRARMPADFRHGLLACYLGINTVSITWITPLLAGTSVLITRRLRLVLEQGIQIRLRDLREGFVGGSEDREGARPL